MVFKEISAIKKLQSTKNKEKFTNIFINSTAHNIFTPINGLLGIAELIEREVTHVSQASQYVKIMKNCINHLYFTTQNIIEHSRLRLKQQINETKEINVCDLISKVSQIFQEDALKKKILYSLNIDQSSKIFIDESKVSLVFYNILSNAFKYTEQGQLTVEAKIIEQIQILDIQSKLDEKLKDQIKDFNLSNELTQQQQYLYVSVTDSGTGISDVYPDKLFNLFSSFKISQDSINQQGLGLGLSISSLICKQLGGILIVEYSVLNKGSKFSFIIPIVVIQQNIEQLYQDNQFYLNSKSLRLESQIEVEDCCPSYSTDRNNHSQIKFYEFQLSVLTHCDDEYIATKNLNFKNFNSRIQEELEYSNNLISDNDSMRESQKQNYSFRSQTRKQETQIDCSQNQQQVMIQNSQDLIDISQDLADILIVDDTVFNVEIIKMILKNIFSLSSDQAYSGIQAIEAVQKRKQLIQNNHSSDNISQYKLILMDINMAGLDGVETTRFIRRDFEEQISNREKLMIYAHTAIPECQFGDFKAKGFDGFLPKPLNSDNLKILLHHLKLINL
eukprot:403358685